MIPSSIQSKIITTYNQYDAGEVEFEARFGEYKHSKFKSGVTRQIFNRVNDYFGKKINSVNTRTTDYIQDNIRKTVTIPDNDRNPKVIWIRKTRLWNQPIKEYGIRYSMSRESNIDSIPNFIPDVIREKNRYSYLVFNNSVRIDLTIVNMIQGSHPKSPRSKSYDESRYEIEIELVDPSNMKNLEKAILVTLKLVQDTYVIYTHNQKMEIINYTNKILNSDWRGNIDHKSMVQARNLKTIDMVYGGLIGNKNTGYSVTHKADGQRKLLVFHKTGIWALMAPQSVMKISSEVIPTLTGTILDGEYIPPARRIKEKSPKTKFWYVSFDCLAYNSDDSVQNRPHGKRMQYAQAVADIIKNSLITVNTKTFRSFGTPQEFFSIMREMFREQSFLAYQQDGFMFTPQNTKYNNHSDKYPLYKRILTVRPDICKWKPKEELTIDFLIKWKPGLNGNDIVLYVNKNGKPVPFKGDKITPYENQVDSSNPATLNFPNGTIVEYGWDYDNNILVPHRIRHDKTKPNKLNIANDVWHDIHFPLDKETMKGETFTLLRKYHNKIKKKLFNEVSSNLTLLDIGSGRGGDVSKWKKFSKIVAVEPNKEHIKELERRLKVNGIFDRVRIVNTGGEDTVQIYKAVREFIGDRVDVISMMLSMTFFWQSLDMMNALSNTILTNIKSTGEMIFLTMDGDLVEQTFEPAFDTGPIIEKLDLGVAVLEYKSDLSPKELYIDIKGTIVEKQREWLVRLDDLKLNMEKYGFDSFTFKKADEEKFLTEEEITMTQMYTYGKIKRTHYNLKLPDIKDVNVKDVYVHPVQYEYPLSPSEDTVEIKQLEPLPTTKEVTKKYTKYKDPTLYLDTYFGVRNNIEGDPKENVNYTPETLTYMTSHNRADQITNIIVDKMLSKNKPIPFEIYECCAGIGGNTLSFLDNDNIKKVTSFEILPERIQMLNNNIEMYNLGEKSVISTTKFAGVDCEHSGDVVLYMDPPWLPAGIKGHKSTKDQYILSGMKISNKTLEEWIKHCCNCAMIVLRVPPGYIIDRVPGFKIETKLIKNSLLIMAYPKKNEETVNSPTLKEINLPSPGVNKVESLETNCYGTLFRIGNITGPSCFLHALLNAFYVNYQVEPNKNKRKIMVDKLRSDLAVSAPSDKLKRLFNSNKYLNFDAFDYISETLKIDIYIMSVSNIKFSLVKKFIRNNKRVVVLSGEKKHCEIVAVKPDKLYQTLFTKSDPLIKKLKQKYK